MKEMKQLSVVVVVVMALAVLVSPGIVLGAVAVPFYDGFEDGNYDGWVRDSDPGDGFCEVTDTTAAVGTYSFHYYGGSEDGTHESGIHQEFTAGAQPEYVSFYVRSGSTSQADGYFRLDAGTPADFTEAIWFYCKGNGYFWVNWVDTYPYQANIWYHIEFRDIDWQNKDFDFYVNGELVEADIPFINPDTVDSFGVLWLYNYNLSDAWWDEIQIGEIPEVTTEAATEIAPDSATLNAHLDSMGDYTTLNVSFKWGTASGALDQETAPQAMTSTNGFTAALGDLDSDTTYYFKAKVTGSVTVYGEELSFTTEKMPPEVTTEAATEIATDSAALNGRLDSMGDYTTLDVSFKWGTTSGTLDQETAPQAMTSTGNFTATLGDLDSGTTYYFRAKVTGSITVYGDESSFTTEEAAGFPVWIWIAIGAVVALIIGMGIVIERGVFRRPA